MNTTKTTVYLSDDLRKAVKKHIIDTGETLSQYVEKAVAAQVEKDMKELSKKQKKTKLREKESAAELDRLIKELSR